MAYNLVDGVPLFGTRFTKTILTAVAIVPGAEFGKNKLSYMEDTYLSPPRRYSHRRDGPHRHQGLLLQSDPDG